MHALLLTVLTLAGANDVATHSAGAGMHVRAPVGMNGGFNHGPCDGCNACGHRHHGKGCICKPMPQTCYDPAYGCYPGSRFMNRYPAFHGTYYRRPYNYRNVFDYPWHAQPPTSLYSYDSVTEHVSGAEVIIPAKPVPAGR